MVLSPIYQSLGFRCPGHGSCVTNTNRNFWIQQTNGVPTISERDGHFLDCGVLNGTSRIYIHGISKVASLLQIQWTQRYFREVSVDRFNTHSKRSAELYASIHKPQGVQVNPMSRACITAITGLSKSQQRRYEVKLALNVHLTMQ